MAGDVEIEKEMGINHADFFRILPQALGSAGFSVSGNVVTLEEDGGEENGGRTLVIEIGPEEARRIARMQIPKTRVRLVFRGYSEERREAALARFWRHFQKGGG